MDLSCSGTGLAKAALIARVMSWTSLEIVWLPCAFESGLTCYLVPFEVCLEQTFIHTSCVLQQVVAYAVNNFNDYSALMSGRQPVESSTAGHLGEAGLKLGICGKTYLSRAGSVTMPVAGPLSLALR